MLPRRGEAHLLAVGLLGDVQAKTLGGGANVGLVQLTDGKEGVLHLGAREPVQEVALVLARIQSSGEPRRAVRVPHDARVVSGRQEVRSLSADLGEQVGELEPVVADDARVGCAPGSVLIGERSHDLTLERVAEVQRVVRDAEQIADPPRVANRADRTAAALII